jgi:two-component system, cell cycle sensor histidine kinase and response regulator CckA
MSDTDRSILDALDQAPAAVAVLRGPELRYAYLNDPFRRLVPNTVIGDRFGAHTEQGARFRTLGLQVIESGQQVQLRELAIDLPGGNRVYFDVLMHPLRGEGGGLIVIGTDVTARMEAQRAAAEQAQRARRAEAQLLAVLEQGPVTVSALDPSGQVIFMSGGELRRHGYEPSQFVGRNALELYADDPPVAALIRRALTGEAFNTLIPRPSRNATYELYFTPVRDPSGALEMVVSVGVDVSRRLRAEEERARIQEKMLQTQKLESLGVLAGGIAHDFNNLLTVIQGNATVALARVGAAHPARELIDDILTATQRAAELTRQMLAYSGQGRFDIKPLDLRAQVTEIANLLRTSIPRKVALRIDQPPELPAVQGDSSQLQQVVMNLMLNAAESMGDREGQVAVSLGEEQIGHDGGGELIGRERLPEGRYVRLGVEDTGSGMSPPILARIFDPFFTTKATGRGLGLAAVLGIVRGHGGALRIRSEPGRGTRFDVLLPAAGARAASPAPGEAPEPGKGTVLVVDDDESVRIATARMLSALGYDVLEAQDGGQAVEIFRLRSSKVDVVVLDVTMPHLSGEETLLLLREVDPAVRVVMFSGYAEGDVEARLGPLRPQAILAKPFTRTQLATAIQTALQK